MPLTVACPNCSAKLKVPDEAVGRKVKCPKCTTLISVGVEEPEPPAVEAAEEPAAAPEVRSPRRPPKKSKTGLIIGLVVGLVLLSGCCCGGVALGIYAVVRTETNDKVTYENAQKLKADMTLAEVEAIFGKDTGKKAQMADVSEAINRDPNKKFEQLQASYKGPVDGGRVYRWKNGRDTSVIIVFTTPPETGGKARYIYFTSKTDKATLVLQIGNSSF